MFKFLRKYSKWILAVGGTLLMITFLVPQAIQSLTQQAARRGVTWARVGPDEEKVSSDVLRQCQAELQALDDLGQRVAGLGPIKQPEHWYLLQREADEAGLVGGWASDVLSAEEMQLIITRTANPARTVDEALGKLNSVNQLMLMYANGARLSDQRLRGYARRTFHVVDTRIVVLEGNPEANVPDPTEEEIVAQFKTYGDVQPGEGERGFGYRRSDRFKIEWLTIPADGIRTMVETSDELNAIALAKHWQKHQIDRGFPEVDPSGPIPDVVREDLINELTDAKRDAVERFANNQLLDSWRTLKSTGDGYRDVPDDWAKRRVEFTAIAEAVRDKFPGLELPAYQAIGDRWLAVDDISEFESLNSASTDKFGRPVAVRQLLASIRDFGGEADIPMQTGLAAPPLRNAARDIVFLRVTDVDPARPAHDVDEVRDEIVQDLRRLAHFEQLRGQMDAIEAAARESGLLYVAVENDAEVQRTTPMSLYDPQWVNFQLNNRQIGVSPIPTTVPGLGAAPDAVQTIVERALAFPLDVPLQDQPVEQRTFVIPVEERMALLVVQLERHTPLDQGRFDQLCQSGLEGLVLNEELLDTDLTLADVFGYDALAARHRFVIQQRKDDEAEETDAEDDTTASEPAAASVGSSAP